jgi:hypothetical protein
MKWRAADPSTSLRVNGRGAWLVTCIALLASAPALAWNSHSFASYRALEKMPELANTQPIHAEPLDDFLKSEERALEALLASQEAWANANLAAAYPVRPAALAFKAEPARGDAARRQAFLRALRVAPDSRFALYLQPDPQAAPALSRAEGPDPGLPPLPYSAVNTLPEPANNTSTRFVALRPGQPVNPLAVVATATQEPDFGLDINLFEDSPSEWGKAYGFGKLPFGNPAVNFSTQAPFHMGFYHQDRVLYMAAPFLKRTFPVLRAYQFATLAALAFRTGHPYWGWRFAGMSLHYVQDLTQPYHASLAPGQGTWKLMAINTLAMVGFPKAKSEMVTLLSNQHLALERYQAELVLDAELAHQDTPILQALHNTSLDVGYPAWNTLSARDVVAAEAAAYADKLVAVLLAAMPPAYVSDPSFDVGASEARVSFTAELAKQALKPGAGKSALAALDASIAELLGHYGAHSRNALRAILRAGTPGLR